MNDNIDQYGNLIPGVDVDGNPTGNVGAGNVGVGTSTPPPAPEPTPEPRPARESSSPFFQVNIDAILMHQVGFMKKTPWWLRWLYSAVVTKEKYRGDSY